MRIYRFLFLMMMILFVSPLPAYADIGLPMLAIVWPVFWLALIPIIFIEWRVLKRVLLGFSSKRLFYVAAFSNFLSTLIGIPVAWACLVGIEIAGHPLGTTGTFPSLNTFWQFVLGVTIQAPWLIPYEDQFYWMIPTAFLVLLIPFFFISYWIEAFITLKCLKKDRATPAVIKKAVWKANLQSYAFLFLLNVFFLIYGIITKNQILLDLLNKILSFLL